MTITINAQVFEKPTSYAVPAAKLTTQGFRYGSIYAPGIFAESSGDSVQSVTMTVQGSGYTSVPQVTFTGSSTRIATGIAVLGFALSAVAITSPGVYTTVPTIGATVGTGATFTYTMKAVNSLPVTYPSAGVLYEPGDTWTSSGGTFTTAAVLAIDTVQLAIVAIANGGKNFEVGDTLTLTGGIIRDAAYPQLTVQSVDTNGGVTSFAITNRGVFLGTSATLVQYSTSGVGDGFTADSALFNVLTTSVVTAGSYTVLPTNPVEQGSTSGSGVSAFINMQWGFATIAVSAGGSDYDATSQMTFTGSGAVAAATITLASSGGVKAVTVLDGGDGYAAAPSVGFVGGGGTLAAGTANLEPNYDTIDVAFSQPLSSTNYTVLAYPNEKCAVSVSTKTVNGFVLTLTPLSGGSIVDGTIDLVIEINE